MNVGKPVKPCVNPKDTNIKIDLSSTPKFTVEDITTDSLIKYKLDKGFSQILEINVWSTFKEVILGFLKINKKMNGRFYDRNSVSFKASELPSLIKYFPKFKKYKSNKSKKITNLDIREYLI